VLFRKAAIAAGPIFASIRGSNPFALVLIRFCVIRAFARFVFEAAPFLLNIPRSSLCP
jgi:hypothetical protein